MIVVETEDVEVVKVYVVKVKESCGKLGLIKDGYYTLSSVNAGKFVDVDLVSEHGVEGAGSPCLEPSPTGNLELLSAEE